MHAVCMAAGLDRSPLHREKDDFKLNFRIFMLIFICCVVVIVILKEQSDLNRVARLPACVDYALPQSTADNADLPVFFAASRFVFCLIRCSVKFGIVY